MWLSLLVVVAASPAQWLGPPLKGPATRVVTLAPSLTETVLALDAGVHLVGVSRFDERPEVATLPRMGGFNDLAVETIVAARPDLVVVQKSPGNQKAVEALSRSGVTVLALPLTSIADVSVGLSTLGAALGRTEEAKGLVAALAQARHQAQRTRPQTPKRVLFVYGWSPVVVAGPGSFADELLTDCGARNVAKAAPTPYPVLSMERLARLSVEVVVDAADVHEGRSAVEALPTLATASWVTLTDTALLHPGPALTQALPGLCRLVR